MKSREKNILSNFHSLGGQICANVRCLLCGSQSETAFKRSGLKCIFEMRQCHRHECYKCACVCVCVCMIDVVISDI